MKHINNEIYGVMALLTALWSLPSPGSSPVSPSPAAALSSATPAPVITPSDFAEDQTELAADLEEASAADISEDEVAFEALDTINGTITLPSGDTISDISDGFTAVASPPPTIMTPPPAVTQATPVPIVMTAPPSPPPAMLATPLPIVMMAPPSPAPAPNGAH